MTLLRMLVLHLLLMQMWSQSVFGAEVDSTPSTVLLQGETRGETVFRDSDSTHDRLWQSSREAMKRYDSSIEAMNKGNN
mgnify:CR=1 FL=1